MTMEDLLAENRRLKSDNEELRSSLFHANTLNERTNTFIAQISREIRTPLNVVIGLASIAREQVRDDHPAEACGNLTDIENSSRVLLGIVDNILDISALASGTLRINAAKFNLKEQMTNLAISFYEQAKQKNVHFEIHIQGVSEEFIIGDEHRLNQIVAILFSNSLQYTPAGGRIDVSVTQASSSRNRVHMRFSVRDSGCSVPQSVIDHLFQPIDADTPSPDSADSPAVNLYLTKEIVTMMGGTVTASSNADSGSEYVVDLPFERTEQEVTDFSALCSDKILVVSDQDELCDERGWMLADMGLPYSTASSHYDALDAIGEAENTASPIKICMVDWNAQSYSAARLISEIREIFGNDIVIVATAHNSASVCTEGRKVGADYVIENTLFRSTIFDALMKIERGEVLRTDYPEDPAKDYNFSGRRVLVVEDVLLNMEVVVKQLSRVNASIVCAENGAVALQTYLNKPSGYFDCVLMDINMPVMDGYEAARAIRASGKEDAATVPIYAMTANAFTEDIAQALEAGMNGHIAKPIELHLLFRTLNQVFFGHSDEEMHAALLEKAQRLEQQNRELLDRAEHDALTGLLNRYAFEKRMFPLMRRREPLWFVLIDIDHFKTINDTYGHETGDEVLVTAAKVLTESVRDCDYVVRLGGDEFAAVIRSHSNSPDNLRARFTRINERLMHPEDGSPSVSMSFGAVYSDIGYTTELYGLADRALYQTKKNGRCGCTFYNELELCTGTSDAPAHALADYMTFSPAARGSMGDEISVVAYRLLENSLKDQLTRRYGTDVQREIFVAAGFDAGLYFAANLLDTSLRMEDFFRQLRETLTELHVCVLQVDNYDAGSGILSITALEDADCSGLSDLSETVCHYDEGFLSGVLTAYTRQRYSAEEVECWATGYDHCRFIAAPNKDSELNP